MTDEGAEVLVVDDDEALTDVYAAWLGDDYNVVTATTGSVALETLDTDDVDVVLLDRRMPGLSGEDVLERIRHAEYECRVAMVTGVRPNTDVVELGFDEYLLKPVDRDDLKDTVETLLDRSEYDDNLQELYSLMSKRALLESEAEDGSVQLDDAYDDLVDRIEDLRAQINDTVTDFGHDDFRVAFRDLPNGQTGSD